MEQLAGRHDRRSTRIGRNERLRPGATSRLPPEVLEPSLPASIFERVQHLVDEAQEVRPRGIHTAQRLQRLFRAEARCVRDHLPAGVAL